MLGLYQRTLLLVKSSAGLVFAAVKGEWDAKTGVDIISSARAHGAPSDLSRGIQSKSAVLFTTSRLHALLAVT